VYPLTLSTLLPKCWYSSVLFKIKGYFASKLEFIRACPNFHDCAKLQYKICQLEPINRSLDKLLILIHKDN